jgi:putative ABC transport system substrate-binding protein
MASYIGRRKFLATLGGPAAAWPLGARAQQPGKLPTIGYLGAGTSVSESQRVAAFKERLHQLGWIEGRTIAIESRWGEGRSDRASEIAGELVRLKVDIIVTSGTPQVIALKQATSVIPIVSPTMGDPVGAGLIASLARPGGNVTGLSLLQPDLGGKRLEVLREAIPGLRRLAILGNFSNPPHRAGIARGTSSSRSARRRGRNHRDQASRGYQARFRRAERRGRALSRH